MPTNPLYVRVDVECLGLHPTNRRCSVRTNLTFTVRIEVILPPRFAASKEADAEGCLKSAPNRQVIYYKSCLSQRLSISMYLIEKDPCVYHCTTFAEALVERCTKVLFLLVWQLRCNHLSRKGRVSTLDPDFLPHR